MTSNAGCVSTSTVTSNAITIVVSTGVAPAVSITSGNTTICAGASVTFTAAPTNGGTTPSYQWKVNGVNSGTNASTFTTTTLTNGAVVTVVMTSNASCASPTTATSNAITMVVNSSVTPSLSIAAAANPICSGGSLSLTASPTNGGSAPTYQWKKNGTNITGATGLTYSTTTALNGDVFSCVMTANNACQTSSSATSNNVTAQVTSSIIPTASITASSTTVCSGGSVTFTAAPTNGGTTPSYQWKVNGVNSGTNASTFTTTTLTNGAVVTVVMTSNASCASPTTATSNAITMVVNNLVVYYQDQDGDGFGNAQFSQSSCSPLNGFVSNSSDCDDNNGQVNPSWPEVCNNQIDDNCNGVVDENCVAILGCIDQSACNFNPTATEDDGSCIYPQPEVCNQIDDDCNDLVDDGISVSSLTPVVFSTNVYPTCSSNNLKAANLTLGSDSPITEGSGLDIWYRFTAQKNTLRAGLSAATGDNSLEIYTQLDNCLVLLEAEHEVTSGNQTLFADALVVGQDYYIACRSLSGPINASAKICFNHFDGSTCDHVYSNYTGVYANVCRTFKAVFKGNASNYLFNVTGATAQGIPLSIQPWSYTTPTSNSIISRLGSLLPANFGVNPIVYNLNVGVNYVLLDAAGNSEFIAAQGTEPCTITLNPEATVTLRSVDRCPNIKAINNSIATDRQVCGATRYQWEFTEVLPNPQAPVVVQGGLNTNVLFLNLVPGMANGKTYNVRVRSVHVTGQIGEWGAVHCLKTTGAGMVLEEGLIDEQAVIGETNEIQIFPNPSGTGELNVFMAKGWNEDNVRVEIWNAQGQKVFSKDEVLSGHRWNVVLSDHIASGIYWIKLSHNGQEDRLRWILTR
jgi:hypothetical protein